MLGHDDADNVLVAQMFDDGSLQAERACRTEKNEAVIDLNAAAGTNTLNGTAVPAGQVWVITLGNCWNGNRGINMQLLIRDASGALHVFIDATSAGAGCYLVWTGWLALYAGDYVRAIFFNCVLSDDIGYRVRGYTLTV